MTNKSLSEKVFIDGVDLDYISMSDDHSTAIFPNELLSKDMEVYHEIWKDRRRKYELEENIKAITRIVELSSEYSFDWERITEDIWKYKKTRIMKGSIKLLEHDDLDIFGGSPLFFKGRDNTYIIASISNRSELDNEIKDIDVSLLMTWLKKKIERIEMEKSLNGDEIF